MVLHFFIKPDNMLEIKSFLYLYDHNKQLGFNISALIDDHTGRRPRTWQARLPLRFRLRSVRVPTFETRHSSMTQQSAPCLSAQRLTILQSLRRWDLARTETKAPSHKSSWNGCSTTLHHFRGVWSGHVLLECHTLVSPILRSSTHGNNWSFNVIN
jgi:hypothetical protein